MADNYLERHREDYEAKKAAWLRRKSRLPRTVSRKLERPDDEAL